MNAILVLAQQKGGAGKTTLAVQLAHAFSARGRGVRLVDLDPQNSLTRWAELRQPSDIPCETLPEWQASTGLKKASAKAELLIVDCPGNADILLRAALRIAHLVLVPVQPSPLDAWAAAPTLEACIKEKARHSIVLNRVPPRGGALDATRKALSEHPILEETIGARVAFSNAFLKGRAAAETHPRSKAAAEVSALADAVAERLPTS
ncbi:MAG: ParA family partition ATPase [Pseudomonadota bacterium]